MAQREIYSKDMVLTLAMESALGAGSGATITLPAAVNGAVPVGSCTVASGGTSYPISSNRIYVLFSIGGNSSAYGYISTNASGIVSNAVVLDGGFGYSHVTGTAATVKASINSAYGTGTAGISAGVGVADAVLIGADMTIEYQQVTDTRSTLRTYRNADATISGDRWVKISFSIELSGSGAAATPAMWGRLLRIAGMSEIITAGTKVDYSLVSDDYPSGAGQLYYGAVVHNIRGVRAATLDSDFTVSKIPKIKVELMAMISDPFSRNIIVPTFTAWNPPMVITDGNSGDIQIGAAYNTSTGLFTGGASYPSLGLKWKLSNTIKYRTMLGGLSGVYISDRNITGTCTVDEMPHSRIQSFADWSNNITRSLAFTLGNSVGGIVKTFITNRAVTDLKPTDVDGKLMTEISFEGRPTEGVGNDEVRVITM